jgi:hypothetical protein
MVSYLYDMTLSLCVSLRVESQAECVLACLLSVCVRTCVYLCVYLSTATLRLSVYMTCLPLIQVRGLCVHVCVFVRVFLTISLCVYRLRPLRLSVCYLIYITCLYLL